MKLLSTRKRRHMAIGIATALGVLLLAAASWVASYQDPQVAYYNKGIELAQNGDMENAMKAFDKSIAAYSQEQDRNAVEKFLLPAPSLELAALAHKQRGLIFIMAKKPDQAVLAFKESLKLNPGDSYTGSVGTTKDKFGNNPGVAPSPPPGIDRATYERMKEEALVVKYDLELLYKKNPQQAQGEGKGKPQDGDGKGQPKPAPGNDPGKLPGKGNKDDI